MAKAKAESLIPVDRIAARIYLIRGRTVMLDSDLAELYGVPTKVLNQAVTRNLERFPEDFMFQLSKDEFDDLRSQIVTSNWAAGVIHRGPSPRKAWRCSTACYGANRPFKSTSAS